MGMYDHICGNMTCPQCHKETYVIDQIKWLPYEERQLKYYSTGCDIHMADGTYHHGSEVRRQLYGICEFCHAQFPFRVVVKNGKIDHLEYD